MSNSTVQALTFVTMGIAIVFGFLIPAVMFVVLRKKFGCKKMPFFAGCAAFFLGAVVLEGLFHTIILGGGRAQVLMAKPVLYGLYGGFMAGLFEETARFVAYKVLLKKGGDIYADNSTALSYGAGHGGFEAFYILVVSMITNLVFGIMINTGNTEVLFMGADEAKTAQVLSVLNQLVATNPWMFLVSVMERFGAVAVHVSLSVLVWFAAKNKKYYFYLLAIILHLLLDMIAGTGTLLGLPVFVIEIILYVYAAFCAFLSYKVWKKESKKVE